MKKQERTYSIDVRSVFPSHEAYYSQKRYGHFAPDGTFYTVTDPNTPRSWNNILSNRRMASVISNRGMGFFSYGSLYNRVTRYHEPELYILREPEWGRTAEISDPESGDCFSIFDAPSLRCTVTPVSSVFTGEEMGVRFSLTVFLPEDAPCECWLISLEDVSGVERTLTIHVGETLAFHNANRTYGPKKPAEKVNTVRIDSGFFAEAEGLNLPFDRLCSVFAIEGCTNGYVQKKIEKVLTSKQKDVILGGAVYKDFHYTDLHLYADVTLPAGGRVERCVLAGASHEDGELTALIGNYLSCEKAGQALSVLQNAKKIDYGHNVCRIPDKNLERFLNVWLKNQIQLIYYYNRNRQNAGYRDLWQDMWGAMLIAPDFAKQRMGEALSHVYPDGHVMRGYDTYSGVTDHDDFVDCPLWAPATVSAYVKETGDVDFLLREFPYFESEEKGSVIDHLWRMVEHPYRNRGANGLVLMRDGDWLDGLSGINQNGTATSAWATMQAFWAQNILAELLELAGDRERAAILKERSEEYRRIVREVAWDGNWYVYAFKGDGLPVGSHKCREGKIYINAQAWALFTGIETDPNRIKRMQQAIHTYLTTPYGPMLLYPPYVNDKTCGRIHSQIPGTFANAAVYLHAGAFSVWGEYAAGEYDEAYDVMMRLLPGHVDNPDGRRTSEPWCTGNVHFGPDSTSAGTNLFSWFTATPDWIIHAGFDRLLGVEIGFKTLSVNPRVPADWNEFSVQRLWQGKHFAFDCRRAADGEKTGIYRDGAFLGDHLTQASPEGNYTVLY